jgi:hypothetical protein
MIKRLLFSFVILSLFACSLPFKLVKNQEPTPTLPNTPTAPGVTPTARVEIIYRLPSEMNLQPQDVPELTETQVEQPAQEPLLPEAIDQSQRAYNNPSQDTNIESNVIMVPGRTVRTPDEIADVIIKKRRPDCKWIGDDEGTCNIGERCKRKRISCGCGSGLVIIVIRSNIIAVVIGCGRGVKTDLIDRIGGIIDGRIKAPARPKVTVPPTAEVIPIVTEDVCESLNLTPEECINSGLHYYTWSSYDQTGPYCSGMPEGRGPGEQWNVSFQFSNDSVRVNIGQQQIYQRKGQNYFVYEDSDFLGTYTFLPDGFISEDNVKGSCITKYIYTFSSSKGGATATPVPGAAPSNDYTPQPGDGALTRDPAYIDNTQILNLGTSPQTYGLHIQGSLPTPCHKLRVNVPAPDQNNQIMVEVYSVVNPNDICLQVLQDFDVQVPLGNLPTGQFIVFVNGEQIGEINIP